MAVLSSRRAPGLAHLAELPGRGRLFDIACCLTTEEEFADRAVAEDAGIPVLTRLLRRHHRERGAPLSDRVARTAFDAETARALAPAQADIVLLAGYLYLLTHPMLLAFPRRIFNVHGSDLRLRDSAGHPKYPGLRAVRDAIAAGEASTRASLHRVTEGLDEGPVLAVSWPFPVSPAAGDARERGASDALKAYAFAHQEWMLARAWGPLLEHAVMASAVGLPLRGGRGEAPPEIAAPGARPAVAAGGLA